MSLVNRTYPEIVRDVLTTLTQGVTGEKHEVKYDPSAKPLVIPDIMLEKRPVRRVTAVEGFVAAAVEGGKPVATTFSLNDYELIPSPAAPDDYVGIRFRPLARRKPAPDTVVTINYYPRTTDPTPLTDLNIGSVTRTIVEAMSRELAGLYAQLNLAYDSAFIETATGDALDQVTALLDYKRFRAGHAVGSVTFTRRPGASGSISIPAGTPITDGADKIRYVTSERYDMLAGESVAEVRVQGATQGTPEVEAGILAVVQRAIAGLDTVSNSRPTTRASQDETDEALRARTRDALLTANKGTLEAIEHGLMAMPGVTGVSIVEMPNGVAGEIQVSVQLDNPPPAGSDLPQHIVDRIEELRPAGIRVLRGLAPMVALEIRLALVLAGASLASADVEAVKAGVRTKLRDEIRRKGVGERIRAKPLAAVLLGDARIADVTLTIGPRGGTAAAGEDYQPAADAGTTLDAADIVIDPETFANTAPPSGQKTRVDINAIIGAAPIGGTAPAAILAELTAKLTAYAATLTAGMTIDSASLLEALRNDTLYAVDPIKLNVLLTVNDQFVQITQGGKAFEVGGDQSFTVVSVAPAP
ncbi:MAG: hypothetical protein V4574_10520 [Pseudomonadota bacterium]